MIVEGVDPRNIEWEVDRPAYRVYFWHQPPAPAGVAPTELMWHCEEYRLSDVTDVEEILGWARARATPDQTVVVYAECGDLGRSGLVRLWGVDPSDSR